MSRKTHRRAGSLLYQTNQLFAAAHAVGTSKHAAKRDGSATERVFALRTDWNYRDACLLFARWARDTHGCQDVAEAVRHPEWGLAWVEALRARGKAASTIKTYASGVAKACAIVAPDRREAWTVVVAAVGRRRPPPPRGYGTNAERLIAAVAETSRDAALVLQVALESGARIGEVVPTQRAGNHFLTADRLLGDNQVLLVGKGGLERVQPLTPATYRTLLDRAQGRDDDAPLFDVTDRDVQRQLHLACRRLGITPTGVHGLRYDFANRLHQRLIDAGLTEDEADREVSRHLGHRRPAITRHYLR